jgi:hypothetical protein
MVEYWNTGMMEWWMVDGGWWMVRRDRRILGCGVGLDNEREARVSPARGFPVAWTLIVGAERTIANLHVFVRHG